MKKLDLITSFAILYCMDAHHFIRIHIPLIECHYGAWIQFQRPCFRFIRRKHCVPSLLNSFYLSRFSVFSVQWYQSS